MARVGKAKANKRQPKVDTELRTFIRIRSEQLTAWEYLRSNNEQLRAALKPFADYMDACEARGLRDHCPLGVQSVGSFPRLTVGDLHRAREALAQVSRAAERTMRLEIERLKAALTVMKVPEDGSVNKSNADGKFKPLSG